MNEMMRNGTHFGVPNCVDPTLSPNIPRLAVGGFLESTEAERGLRYLPLLLSLILSQTWKARCQHELIVGSSVCSING